MDVSKVQARKLVLVSSLALLAIAVYRNRQSETPAITFRRMWATGVVWLLLSLLADFAPAIAGPFAVLTVLGWIVKDGTQLLDQALGLGPSAAPNTSTATARSGNTVTHTTQTGP